MDESFDPYKKWLGIAPKDQPPNHYRLLGIDRFESDADVIGNAADQRMAHIRTFQHSQRATLSQKILNELSSARVCLLDETRKAAYDEQLRAETSAAKLPQITMAPAPARDVGPPPGVRPVDPAPPVADGADDAQYAEAPAIRFARDWQKLTTHVLAIVAGVALLVLFIGIGMAIVSSRENDGATSGELSKDSGSESQTNTASPPQLPPKLQPIRDMEISAGKVVQFDLRYIGGVPRDGYDLVLKQAPAGAMINAGQFLWTPTEEQSPGEYTVVIDLVAKESTEVVSTAKFQATVSEVDQPLVLDAIPDQVIEEGNRLSLRISASGSTKSVSFAVEDAPQGATIDSTSGEFSWLPGPGQGGTTHRVTVSATPYDGSPEARREFQIRCIASAGKTDGRGLRAELFAGRDFSTKLANRVVRTAEWYARDRLNDVSTGAPQNHSLRFSGLVKPPLPGLYKIFAVTNGAVSLQIQGAATIGNGQPGPVREISGEVQLEDAPTPIQLEYSRAGPGSFVQLRWTRPDGLTELIPAACLYHSADAATKTSVEPLSNETSGLQVEVFRDVGQRERVSNDVDLHVDENWVHTPPMKIDSGRPFAVRWTGWVHAPQSGRFQITVVHDGVCQLKIDDKPLAMRRQGFGPGPGRSVAEVELKGSHSVELFYVHRFGPALCSLRWIVPGEDAERIIPPSALSHDRAEMIVKLAVPDEKARQAAQRRLEENYAAELKAGKSDRKVLHQLARQLVRQAATSLEDGLTRFAMLDFARGIAAKSGNPSLAWRAIAAMDNIFLIDDTTELKAIVLRDAAPVSRSPVAACNVVIMFLRVADEFAQQDRFQDALDLMSDVSATAVNSECRDLRIRFVALGRILRAFVEEKEALDTAVDTLRASPEDRQASFVRGRYLCLVAGKWEEGLPLLTLSDNENYQLAARLELADTNAPTAMRVLGDTWSKVADVEKLVMRRQALQRALHWYERAAETVEDQDLARTIAKLRGFVSTGKISPVAKKAPLTQQQSFEIAQRVLQSKGSFVVINRGAQKFYTTKELFGYMKTGKGKPFTITQISLSNTKVNDETMRQLGRVTTLESLSIGGAGISNTGVEHLRGLEHLETLSIKAPGLGDDAIFHLLDLPRLRHLGLESNKFSGYTLAELRHHSALQSLTLTGSALSDATLMELAECRNIDTLRLNGVRLEPMSVAYLDEMSGLVSLYLNGEAINDEVLAEVARLSGITTLGVGTQVTPDGILRLKNMGLQTLHVESEHLGDKDLGVFAELVGLSELRLDTRSIGDAGTSQLAKLNGLSSLYISRADGVTDIGLRSLQDLDSARTIELTNARYTLAGYKQFREARPRCELFPIPNLSKNKGRRR